MFREDAYRYAYVPRDILTCTQTNKILVDLVWFSLLDVNEKDIERQLLIKKVKDAWGGKVEKEGDRVVGPYKMPSSPEDVDLMIERLTENDLGKVKCLRVFVFGV